MHEPNPIDIAAKASGEPVFREVGVGPWSQTHPGEPRPDDPQSPNFDTRLDSALLDEGDRRNVLDRYRYWRWQLKIGPMISISGPWCVLQTLLPHALFISLGRISGTARAH